ncbi:MAG: type II toxin-antitoxin system RelE/ParE family toxin [Clostridia bacterium]|nr:type II toxin-antitoxin system RelE/ParE family toxin [Clostridia bacterium]
MYEIIFAPPAEKYFKKLRDKKLKQKLKDAIIKISDNPYIAEEKRGDLSGFRSYDVSYNGTNYEIAYRVYEINGKKVVIVLAGTRENFYEELKRIARNY